jgi:signal transduction histidine kinase
MYDYDKLQSIIPTNDEGRLKKLNDYQILDTAPEEAFDKIAKLAAQIFDTPSAFVSFVDKDRVFFKSNLSTLEGNQVPRGDSLCSLAILAEGITVFNDTHQIPYLLSNPFVCTDGGIRFYAGAPLKTAQGYQLGTICVTDSMPRTATEKQLQMLQTLSSIVVDELEQRLSAKRAVRVQTDLMNMAVHELKNPALNVSMIADFLAKKSSDADFVRELAGKLKLSSEEMISKLDFMLRLSHMEEADFELHLQEVDIVSVLKEVKSSFGLLAEQKGQIIELETADKIPAVVDRARIREVFENLVGNAIKYSYPNTKIIVKARSEGEQVMVEIKDQGQGLNERDIENLFTKFAKLSSVPTGKERSNGLGLSIVKTLVELHQGKVWAISDGKDKGATFFVSLPVKRLLKCS